MAFDCIYQIAYNLFQLSQKDYLGNPRIVHDPQLWLKEIYPRYLAHLELFIAKAKIANDNGHLVASQRLNSLRERCLQVVDAFNKEFCKLVEGHYREWLSNPASRPVLTCDLLDRVFVPEFKRFVKNESNNVYLIVFDGLRYDTWLELKPLVEECFGNRLALTHEECVLSILPTATQYTRKAIFAGSLPSLWRRRDNGIDPETSEIRLLKEKLRQREIPFVDRLSDSLVTAGESEMKEDMIRALVGDKTQVIKPIIFNVSDDKIHNEDADLKTLYDSICAEFRNRIRPILSQIDDKSLVIIVSDHGFYDIWGTHKQTIPQFYGAIRWRYGALRKEDSELGFPDDVVALRSRDIGLNVEYTYRLESTKEFGAADDGYTTGKKYAYPLYVFSKPGAILGRRKIAENDNVALILEQAEILQGSSKLRYEHGGISVQEMIVPMAIYSPSKKAGKPTLRIELAPEKYVDGTPATLTIKLFNTGTAAAENVIVSVDGIAETRLFESIEPSGQEPVYLDFSFIPSRGATKYAVTVGYSYAGQQAFVTQTVELVVDEQPGKIERPKLF